jgi:hypothetical protein
MSHNLRSVNKIHLTAFNGGKDRGKCLQLMVGNDIYGQYAELTRQDALDLLSVIANWVAWTDGREELETEE